MKTIKFLLSILFFLFFLFSSVDGFSQIIEDTNICTTIGSSASFTVVTSEPSPTSFVWQYKSPTSSSWTTINSSMGDVYSGYNTATLNITKSSGLPVTGTLYMVEVNAGSNNLISNEATLTIDPKPVSKLITGASAVCAGSDKTLTYGAGSVGEILWQYSTTSSTSDFYDLDLETERTYVATDLQDTTWFQVMNTSGVCAPSYSPAVQVVVNPLPVAGNIDGGDINVCSGSNTTTLTLYNHEGAIQWQKALDVAGSPGTPGTFANITSAILPDYSATNLTATTYFRAVLSSGVCTSEFTEPVFIIVDPVPISKLITGASQVCTGSDKTLTYGAGSVGDIQWHSSTTAPTEEIDYFSEITGETERTYTATDLQETTWFWVMNTSGDVCAPAQSPAVQVVVNPLPVAGNIVGGGINVCKLSNSTALTLLNYVGDIQWQKASEVAGSSGTPGTFANITSAILPDYIATNLTATTYFRAVLSSGVCTSVTTDPFDPEYPGDIIVDLTPISSRKITGASPACIGWSKVLTYGAGSVGDIQWQSSTTSSTAGFNDIIGETEPIYTVTDLQKNTWYRVINTSGKCGSAEAVQVVLNPLNAGKIEGGNSIVSKKSNETELTLKNYTGAIQWQKAASLTGVFTNIPLSTSSTYITTGLTETTYFRTLVSNGDCSAVASDPVVVNVASEFKALAYPNPFETEFNINLTPQSTDPIELKIYDMLGRLIENHYVKPSEINSIRMGTTYPAGFFTVLIKQGLQERNVKVLKK